MALWNTTAGRGLVVTLVVAALALGAGLLRVEQATRPGRAGASGIDFESIVFDARDVDFHATDGVALSGWLAPGAAGRPAIILCHDFGRDRSSMINLMIRLRESGYTVLAFDFRGHGTSAGETSTLGLTEKRDVLGAIDLLQRDGDRYPGLGVYGAGMGAHAAVLAASDRRVVRVLVLDGLYPDVRWPLADRFWDGWRPGVDHLDFVPATLFALRHRTSLDSDRAADRVGQLLGRDLLLLSPAGDTRLAVEIERMYASIPDQWDADGNMVMLPATETSGFRGAERSRYHDRVGEFFESRLR